MDPYLMHKTPINLTEVILNPEKNYSYEVFPESKDNRMELKYSNKTNFLIQKKWINGQKSEQDSLSIRIIDESGKYTIHLVCPLKKLIVKYRKNKNIRPKIYTIANNIISEEGSNKFYENLSKISQIIYVSSHVLLSHFKKCIELYLKNMPYDFNFDTNIKYNPSNL